MPPPKGKRPNKRLADKRARHLLSEGKTAAERLRALVQKRRQALSVSP